MNLDIAGGFLRAAGHEATYAEGGIEAVTAVATTDFDLVLMDVRMPGVDGLEATRRIRALGGRRGRVPIVALTAWVFSDQVNECFKAGMDGHLAKPFTSDALRDAVASAWRGRSSGDPKAKSAAVLEAEVGHRDLMVAAS
jgi:CheY-like chemotaxis protein